jgi:hypothetical protein
VKYLPTANLIAAIAASLAALAASISVIISAVSLKRTTKQTEILTKQFDISEQARASGDIEAVEGAVTWENWGRDRPLPVPPPDPREKVSGLPRDWLPYNSLLRPAAGFN